jgi:hypothetical protein
MAFFVDRTFYKSNSNNLLIAQTNSGIGTPTEQIAVPTSITGTITTTSGSTAVVGVGTLFLTEVAVGDYLYSSTDQYIGRIALVTNNLNLVLETGGAYVTLAAVICKKSISTGATLSGDILVRVGVLYVNPTTSAIPKVSSLRNPNGGLTSSYTDTAFISLSRVSTAGTPGTSVGAVNVPMTIERLNTFAQVSLPSGAYFPTVSDFPIYVWYRLNPYGNLATLLDVNTRYYFYWAETLTEINITALMPVSTINNGDY